VPSLKKSFSYSIHYSLKKLSLLTILKLIQWACLSPPQNTYVAISTVSITSSRCRRGHRASILTGRASESNRAQYQDTCAPAYHKWYHFATMLASLTHTTTSLFSKTSATVCCSLILRPRHLPHSIIEGVDYLGDTSFIISLADDFEPDGWRICITQP
jgi:hypothetical protein